MLPLIAAKLIGTILAGEAKRDTKKYSTGSKAPASGIYRCASCKTKRTITKGKKLPPCHDGWIGGKTTN